MASRSENLTVSGMEFYSAYWVAEICIAILATVSNLIVLIAFCTNEKLRTIPNWYIASLSVSDLLMGTFGIPFILIALTGNPKNNYGLCISAVTAIVWIEVCSCFTLFALSFDRYYAVCRPLEYTTKMSQRRALFHIMLAWLTPLLYSMLIPIVWHRGPMDECVFILVADLRCLMVAYLAFFLPMYGIECFMYYKIFQAIRNQLKRLSHIQEVGIRLHLTSVNESTNNVNLTIPKSGLTQNVRDLTTRCANSISTYMLPKRSNLNDEIAVNTETMEPTSLHKSCIESRTKELNIPKAKDDLQYNNKEIDDVNIFGKDFSYLHRTGSCPELNSREALYARTSSTNYNDINDNKMRAQTLTKFSATRPRDNNEYYRSQRSLRVVSGSSYKICETNSVLTEENEVEREDFNRKKTEDNIKLLASQPVNHIQSSRYRQERKTAILFVFILLFFFASWSPIYIIDICLVYNVQVNQGLVNFAVLLSHFNSAFNPILYAYKKEFRNVLKSWRRSLQRFISSKCTKTQQNQIHPSSVW